MPQKWTLAGVGLFAFLLATASCGPSTPTGGDDDDDLTNCPEGFGDCDGNSANGCEADLSEISHCGVCNNVCGDDHATPACVGGQCSLSCVAGYFDCDRLPGNGCEATLGTQLNCSSCGDSCFAPNAVGECVASACTYTCEDGFGDCNDDMSDGCESNLNSATTCGACDVGCTAGCINGQCEACDTGLDIASTDPMDAARAMGLCGSVVEAKWVLPDGSDPGSSSNFDTGHGILDAFGTNVVVREGEKLLALSSGSARQPDDPGYQPVSGYDKGYTCGHPAGFPKESPACPGVETGEAHDGIGLEVTLEVPDWAEGFSFDFDFYTFEWPIYICSEYNDFFVVLLDPIPEGQTDGNISFDSQNNPVSVNNGFLEACGCALGPPCLAGGKTFDCALGTDSLAGTGFETGAATGWLVTQAPAEPTTQITLRFVVYDSGDGVLDSTTIIDGFHWLPIAPDVGTNPIP